jgi:chromosome segregation ATPase
MSTMEAGLKDLIAARDKVEADIANANKTLQETQGKLGEANSHRASLLIKIAAAEKTASELGAAKAAGKAQREKVNRDLADAQAAFDELQKRLNAELPAERRAAIASAVAKLDAAIDDARTDVATARKQTLAAEVAAADAKKKATTAESEYQQAGGELREWPKRAEAARAQLTKLVADAKAAIEAGRINESYLRLLELKQALAALPLISSQASEDKVTASFSEKSKALDAAQLDAAKAAEALNKQKTAQATAEAELKKREQGRAADLKAALAAMPLATVAPPTEEAPPPPAP